MFNSIRNELMQYFFCKFSNSLAKIRLDYFSQTEWCTPCENELNYILDEDMHLMSLNFQSCRAFTEQCHRHSYTIHQFLAIPDNLIKCLINFYSIFSHFTLKILEPQTLLSCSLIRLFLALTLWPPQLLHISSHSRRSCLFHLQVES